MKQLCYFLTLLIALSQIAHCSHSNLNLLDTISNQISGTYKRAKSAQEVLSQRNKKKKNKGKKKKIFPKMQFIWEGWLKFIRITDTESPMRPSSFYVNPEYNYQKVFKMNLKKKDAKGFLNIKDKFQFFGVLKTEGMYIFKTRKMNLGKSVDEIKVMDILKIDESQKYLSSVREIDNFQGNFCMKIKTKYPYNPDINYKEEFKGHLQDYILCLENKKDRDLLVKYLVDLKINQTEQEEIDEKKKPATGISDLTKKMAPTKRIYYPKGWVPKDGYWILLQDWTSCNLKCGGGKSYQQWMCVPPKKHGKPCRGQALRTRPCNIQPCPGTIKVAAGGVHNSDKNQVLKPIIKSMPFSSRPQNYLKCHIKEFDVLYVAENPIPDPDPTKKKKMIKRPARIVMNMHTISLFNDDGYKNAVFSFDLKKTLIAPKRKDKCCFELQNGKESFTICGGFGQACGTANNPIFVNEWVRDFNQFKTTCYENLKIKSWKQAMAKKALGEALEAAGAGGLEDRANLIKKRFVEKEKDLWIKKMQQNQNNALKAMKKEFDIEKMLQQELTLKSELETKQLLNLKKNELKKKDCLEKALKSRDSQNRKIMNTKHKIAEMLSVRNNAKLQIQNERAKLRQKLNAIRNKYKRRKRLIEQDINIIRNEIAKNIINANKKGDMLVCKRALGNKKRIDEYCNREFVDNYTKNLECRQDSSFCYVCCENEYGNMVMELRDKCYKMCDEKMKGALDGGDFYWT